MAAAEPRRRPLGRLERPALAGVLVREVINFSSYWRSTTFSSTVEPTIYLLAFGFGFGSLVSTVGGLRLRRVRRHGHGGHGGAVLVGLPGDVRRPSSSTSSSAPTTRCSPRRSTPRSWSRPRRSGSRRGPASTAARRCWWRWSSGSTRAGGCCSVPFIGFLAGFGWACFGIAIAARTELDRELQLRDQRGDHAAVPGRRHVLPDRPAAGLGAGARPSSTRSTTASSWSATPSSSRSAGTTSTTSRSCSCSAWSCGGSRSCGMMRKLID